MPDEGAPEVSEDRLLAGRVRLRQPRRGHRVGTDAVLLAATASPRDGEVVYDVGAGVGAVGLMLAARSDAAIVFVERDPALVKLCRENIALNAIGGRARAIEADVLGPAQARRAAGLPPGSADLVLTNPPFLDEGRSRHSPDERRAAAHHLPEGGLGDWIAACADLLKARGRLRLVHRADRLGDCLEALGRAFGAVTVRAVHPQADEPATRILVGAVKGSRAPLSLLPPLILHGAAGRFTDEAAAIHNGERLLLRNENGRREAPVP